MSIYDNEDEWKEFCLSKTRYMKMKYCRITKHKLDLENPTRFTQKIQWLKLNDSTALKSKCADKIAVHDYCKEKLGIDICVPIIGIYEKFEDIPWDTLPDKFVLKCNHGSGYNLIVKDKKKFLDPNKCFFERAKKKVANWMAEDYTYRWGCELHYHRIPHKIFIEEFMDVENSVPTDYKFHCFHGEVKSCYVINDRFTKQVHGNYYNMDWQPITDMERKDFPSDYSKLDEKPKHYDEMVKIAEKLSSEFKYVRVDLYEYNDKVYLGELTFYPASGLINFTKEGIDERLCPLLDLNK